MSETCTFVKTGLTEGREVEINKANTKLSIYNLSKGKSWEGFFVVERLSLEPRAKTDYFDVKQSIFTTKHFLKIHNKFSPLNALELDGLSKRSYWMRRMPKTKKAMQKVYLSKSWRREANMISMEFKCWYLLLTKIRSWTVLAWWGVGEKWLVTKFRPIPFKKLEMLPIVVAASNFQF